MRLALAMFAPQDAIEILERLSKDSVDYSRAFSGFCHDISLNVCIMNVSDMVLVARRPTLLLELMLAVLM